MEQEGGADLYHGSSLERQVQRLAWVPTTRHGRFDWQVSNNLLFNLVVKSLKRFFVNDSGLRRFNQRTHFPLTSPHSESVASEHGAAFASVVAVLTAMRLWQYRWLYDDPGQTTAYSAEVLHFYQHILCIRKTSTLILQDCTSSN